MIEMTPEMHERVQSLASDEALGVLISMLRAKYVESWLSSSPEQAATREHLYRMVTACNGLLNEARSIVDDLKVSDFNNRRRNLAAA